MLSENSWWIQSTLSQDAISFLGSITPGESRLAVTNSYRSSHDSPIRSEIDRRHRIEGDYDSITTTFIPLAPEGFPILDRTNPGHGRLGVCTPPFYLYGELKLIPARLRLFDQESGSPAQWITQIKRLLTPTGRVVFDNRSFGPGAHEEKSICLTTFFEDGGVKLIDRLPRDPNHYFLGGYDIFGMNVSHRIMNSVRKAEAAPTKFGIADGAS